jgi:hypothetical protein
MLGLVLGLLAVAPGNRADEDKVDPKKVKAAREAVMKLLESKDLKKEAEVVAKAHGLDAVMVGVFKAQNIRRPAVDNTPGAMPDHIDLKLNKMGKDPPMSPMTLAKEKDSLVKMVELVKATAAVSAYQCPVPKKVGEKDPKKWKDFNEGMFKCSEELLGALKADKPNPAEVRARANKLYATCTGCHGIFRD